jgi:hypothetical protein
MESCRLPGELGQANELALVVVGVDAELRHLGGRGRRVRRERHQHGLERRASVGAEQASRSEGSKAARGFLDRQAGRGGNEAGLVQGRAEVLHGTLGLAGASCQ